MKLQHTLLRSLFGLVAAGLLAPAPARAQDSDQDGVVDALDVSPCDPGVASRLMVPADRAYGMLMFEDLWPAQGDFDFNDAVVAYHEVLSYDGGGRLTRVRLELEVMAVGARRQNGLALRLPVPRDLVSAARVVGQDRLSVATWATEGEAVVTLVPDLHQLFQLDTQSWVNSDPQAAAQPTRHLSFELAIAPGHPVAASEAPFDLFLFNPAHGSEVHRPQYGGTSQLGAALLGSKDDGSAGGRYFVTKQGVPFALDFPELVTYPAEGVAVDQLYPDIVTFGQTAGAQGADFYRTRVHAAAAYPHQAPPEALVAAAAADTSCFVPEPGICGTASGQGSLDAPVAGLCGFGAASPVTTLGGAFQWSCAGHYSQPTPCTAPDWACTPFSQQTCAVANGSGNQTCNGSGTGFNTCQLAACNPGYYASGSTCAPQACSPGSQTSCAVANGTGVQTCNVSGSAWGACQVQTCSSGYALSGGVCVATAPVELKTITQGGVTYNVTLTRNFTETCNTACTRQGRTCNTTLLRQLQAATTGSNLSYQAFVQGTLGLTLRTNSSPSTTSVTPYVRPSDRFFGIGCDSGDWRFSGFNAEVTGCGRTYYTYGPVSDSCASTFVCGSTCGVRICVCN